MFSMTAEHITYISIPPTCMYVHLINMMQQDICLLWSAFSILILIEVDNLKTYIHVIYDCWRICKLRRLLRLSIVMASGS